MRRPGSTAALDSGCVRGHKRLRLPEDDEVEQQEFEREREGLEDGGRTAEVRYDFPQHALQAVEQLDGSWLMGSQISVLLAESRDNTKLQVHGVAWGVEWQELKDHFKQVGQVAFVKIADVPAGHAAAGPGVGEVRYDDPADAGRALEQLDGSIFHGSSISLELDPSNAEGCKLKVQGLPRGTLWQELKDHFSAAGIVAFAQVKAERGGSGGSGATATAGKGSPGPSEGPASSLRMLVSPGARGKRQPPASFTRGLPSDAKTMGGRGALPAPWQQSRTASTPKGAASKSIASGMPSTAPSKVAEVRYKDPRDAQRALKEMNGEFFGGKQVFVQLDNTSPDGSKLLVTGLHHCVDWQEVKERFADIGRVAFVEVRSVPGFVGRSGGDSSAACSRGQGGNRAQPTMSGGFGHGGGYYAARGGGSAPPRQRQPLPMPTSRAHAPSQAPRPIFSSGVSRLAGGLPSSAYRTACSIQGGGRASSSGSAGRSGGRANGTDVGGKTGEIRFEGPTAANAVVEAIRTYDGVTLSGHALHVQQDHTSPDGTKVLITNLPASVKWQELKDMFRNFGQVAFAATSTWQQRK